MNFRLLLFACLLVLLSTFFTDRWITNANTTSRVLPVITVVESGTFCIDKYHEKTNDKSFVRDHYYSDKAPLPTLITIPFFAIMKWTGLVTDHNGSLYGPEAYYLGNFICGSLPFVIILLLGFQYLREKGVDMKRGVVLLLVAFFGSFVFVFAGTFFAHMLSAMFLLLAWLDLEKGRFIRAGLWTGMAFLCEYTLLFFIPLWFIHVIWRTRSWRGPVSFVMGVIPPTLFLAFYNFVFTGSPFDMLYKYHTFQELHTNYGFSMPTMETVWGLSFSPYRGIFFYAPVLLAFLAYSVYSLRSGNLMSRLRNDYTIPTSVFFFLLISAYFGWHGGWTYGPRLLLPVAVLLLIRAIPVLIKGEWYYVSLGLGSLGLIKALMAKATHVYSLPTEEHNPVFNVLWPAVKNGEWNGNDLWSMLVGHPAGISTLIFLLLFIGTLFLSQRMTNYNGLKSK